MTGLIFISKYEGSIGEKLACPLFSAIGTPVILELCCSAKQTKVVSITPKFTDTYSMKSGLWLMILLRNEDQSF